MPDLKYKSIENLPTHIVEKINEMDPDTLVCNIFVKDLLKLRQKIWDKYEESWDEKKGDYMVEEPKEIDELANFIRTFLEENFWGLPVDFVIESLTNLGDSPNIVYDDNGHFACSGCGFQSIPEDLENPSDVEMSFFIEADCWKKTIREAIEYYIKPEEEKEESEEK